MKLLFFVLCIFTAEWIWAGDKPNVIIILSDDAGYADFGFQGSENFSTPSIDSISKNGVKFTNGYVSGAVCSPSRAGLMTGRYQARFGHENNLPPGHKLGMSTKEVTFADSMKSLGYFTGVIGKWHLGYQPEYHPNKRGFDWFYGCLQGSRSYWKIDSPSKNRVIQFNGKETEETDQYITDRLGDNAVSFISQNHKKPFFLYLSFTAVHGPYQSRPEDLNSLGALELSKSRKNLAAMTKSLDDNVAKVLKALKDHKIYENTLIAFLNDNGGTGPAENMPLSGKKGTLYEGGIRVPFCMQWPARIKGGQTLSEPVIAIDLLPSAIAAAGEKVPEEQKLDGLNLLPYLSGKVDVLPRKLFWRKHTGAPTAWAALREGQWKLHKQNDGYQLFNLKSDLQEKIDLKESNPEVFRRLKKDLAAWEAEMMPPLFGAGAKLRAGK